MKKITSRVAALERRVAPDPSRCQCGLPDRLVLVHVSSGKGNSCENGACTGTARSAHAHGVPGWDKRPCASCGRPHSEVHVHRVAKEKRAVETG
jgi:hypothetical protein